MCAQCTYVIRRITARADSRRYIIYIYAYLFYFFLYINPVILSSAHYNMVLRAIVSDGKIICEYGWEIIVRIERKLKYCIRTFYYIYLRIIQLNVGKCV